jgi:hypothetical protein
MQLRSSAQRLALAGSAVLVAGILVPAPAQAAPVFSAFDVDGYAWAHDDSGNCTPNETATPDADNVPAVENGPAVTYSGTATATIQNDTVPADTATATSTGTVTTKVTSVGTNLDTITMSVSGNGSVDTALATSACDVHTGVGGYATFAFTVTEAGWLTIESKSGGSTYSQFELSRTAGGYEQSYSYELKHRSVKTVFLPAGTYTGTAETDIDVSTSVDRSFTTQASLEASFAVAGSQSAAPQGKGAKYVGLGARTCASNTVAAAITSKAKKADKINKVTFRVNGAKVLSDGNPKKGETYNLPVGTDVDAEVTALVKLKKPKPGKPAKTEEVTSSYVACS